MKRWMRWVTRIAVGFGVVCLLAAAGFWLLQHSMTRADAEHARFLACGKTVNDFLKLYASAVKEAQLTGDCDGLLAFYSVEYRSPSRGRWRLVPQHDLADWQLSDLTATGDDSFENREALRDEFASYFGTFSAVDGLVCKINLIEEAEPDERVVLTVKHVLDGRVQDGNEPDSLFEDRFFFRWQLVSDPGSESTAGWKIVRDELVEGVRVAGRGNGFDSPEPESLGINYVHERDPKLDASNPDVRLRFGVMEHASGGVSAVDYDNDRTPDLFFSDGRRCRLFRNCGPRDSLAVTFENVTATCGLDGIDQANCGIFADIDNDGDKDLIVFRYLAPSLVFRNSGPAGDSPYTFTDCTAEFGLDLNAPCTAACFLDYDRDGFVDLYVGLNGNAFTSSPNIPFYATNALPNRLFRNVNGYRFEDVTDSSGTGDTGWTLAVCAGDFNSDGLPDIAVANDFGRKVLYRNNGNGTFTDVAKDAGVLDFSGGMGIAFGDFNFDGSPDLYTSNINSNQRWFGEETTIRQYVRNVVRTRWIFEDLGHFREVYGLVGDEWRELGKMVGEGNSLFYNNGNATFRELKDSHTSRAGWCWGVALFDVDNDTDLDIYAANGWISGKKKDDL